MLQAKLITHSKVRKEIINNLCQKKPKLRGISMITQSVWKKVSVNGNKMVRFLNRVPMTANDRAQMKMDYKREYTQWIIALVVNRINDEKFIHTLVAWGVNEAGLSDRDCGHLKIEKHNEDLTEMWHKWITDSSKGLTSTR